MPLKKALQEKRYDVAAFLIENGIQPDRKDSFLLREVLKDNEIEMLKKLIPFFDLNEPDPEDGQTPLFFVRSCEAAELLLDAGANVDIKDKEGYLPHQQAEIDTAVYEFLKRRYFQNYELSLRDNSSETPKTEPQMDWDTRFMTSKVSISDLVPVECDPATGSFKIRFDNQDFKTSDRFITSLARKLKFSNTIFNYFSAEEVFSRVYERNADVSFKVTFDRQDGEILGVVDENKKMLPAEIVCNVFSQDPRIQKIQYSKGIWEAEFQLEGTFHVANDSEYARKIWVHYPVDGISMPCIYLSVLRKVCSNGAVALVPGFRTDIEINDESGTHLARLLRSYNNESGFLALENRIQSAQNTQASVNELLKISNLLSSQITDRSSVSSLQTKLEEIAGDPCARYEITALNNISPKKRPLLPVDCSVNDLFNFCTELTSHHDNLISNTDAFHSALGGMMVQEFDLEEMYHNQKPAKAFHLNDMELSSNIYQGSAERRNNTVYSR